jgi:methyltransferase
MLDYTEVKKQLNDLISFENIESVVISKPIKKSEEDFTKINVKAIMLKNKLAYQFSMLKNNKMFHKNIEPENVIDEVIDLMNDNFKQCNIIADKYITVLMNKKKQFTVTGVKENMKSVSVASHNKEKNYILKDGEFVDWLYQLGVMDKNGVVLSHKQKKFRQINKFLEMLKDIEHNIPENSVIIDMGCGKSYLTFGIYHYFNNIKNKNVEIRGYDLKKDVVENCNKLAENFGFDRLKFYADDIANIENTDDKISMIITLHACDTATDYAIYHGIRWGCKVIMNVPCCQHELFHQMKNNSMSVIMNNGIIKERFAALLTDGIRARILEIMGYKANVFEFIDMEHTPKNIMIRSVKSNKPVDNKRKEDLDRVIEEYNVMPTLYKLCFGDRN